MFKSTITKQAEKQIKAKKKNKKEETDMKKVIILTVTITLTTVGLFAATFAAGQQYERNRIEQVRAEAKELTVLLAPKQEEPKK